MIIYSDILHELFIIKLPPLKKITWWHCCFEKGKHTIFILINAPSLLSTRKKISYFFFQILYLECHFRTLVLRLQKITLIIGLMWLAKKWQKMAQIYRNWHKKNQIGERKKNPIAKPVYSFQVLCYSIIHMCFSFCDSGPLEEPLNKPLISWQYFKTYMVSEKPLKTFILHD